jgi:hypothetical protein
VNDLLATVNDWGTTRRDVAADYAASLVYGKREDWATINMAIIERWSPSGLKWIKREAWKLAARHPHASNTESRPE